MYALKRTHFSSKLQRLIEEVWNKENENLFTASTYMKITNKNAAKYRSHARKIIDLVAPLLTSDVLAPDRAGAKIR